MIDSVEETNRERGVVVWQRRKALMAKWQWSKKENYKPSKGLSLHAVVY